jgi:tetratricopeptide (TPR) repeat protein
MMLFVAALGCSNPEAQKAEIRELQANQRYAETIGRLETLLDRDPDDPELNHLYGVALLATGNAALAVWPLRKAAENPERAVEDGLLLAQAQLAGGSANDAIATADRILERAPDQVEALLLRAEAKLAEKRSEEALEDVDRVLAQRPDEPAALLARMTALLALEREEDAGEALKAAQAAVAEIEDRDWETRLCAASAVFADEKSDADLAEAEWTSCLKQFPSEPIVVEGSVDFFDGRGEHQRATDIVRQALEAQPEYLPYRLHLAGRLELAGRSDEAERALLEGTEGPVAAEAWIGLAKYYAERGELSKARSAMKRALAQMQDPPPLYQSYYVDLLIRNGDLTAADNAIANIDSPALAHLLRGRLLLARGDARGALESLEAGIRFWPDNGVARQLAAEAAEKLGDYDRAIAEYREAVRNDFSNWEALSRLAALHLAQGTSETVLPLLRRYLRENPGDPRGYRLMIQIARHNGLEPVVRNTLQTLRRLPGQAGVALAEAAIGRGKRDPAAAVQLIEANPLDLTQPLSAEALAVLLENLSLLGRHDRAIRQADAAIAAHPDFAAFHELRGRALLAAGAQPTEVREALARALELEPERVSALVARADLTARAGANGEAVALYDRAAALALDDPAPAWTAIELLMAPSAEPDVERRARKILDAHGYYAPAANLLARRLAARNEDLDRARDLAQRAARFGGGAEALETLGRVEFASGNTELAVEHLRRSLETRPDSPSARYMLGLALDRVGDTEGARRELRKAIDTGSFPEAGEARAALARLGAS